MKRYLILLFLPIFLIGCATDSSNSNTASNTSNNTILMSYHWQLQDATHATGTRINSLFVQPDKPVQLDFRNVRFNISNACNNMGGYYSLLGDQITFSSIISTRKACPDHQIMALDQEISNRLKDTIGYSITQSEQPVLKLITKTGDTLKFTGIKTAETRYGSAGEILFLEVAPQKKACPHPLIPSRQCLQVRQLHYDANGLKSGSPGEWELFYQDIQGYNFKPGIRHVLRVKRYPIANPPADAPNTAYVLDMIIESEIVTP